MINCVTDQVVYLEATDSQLLGGQSSEKTAFNHQNRNIRGRMSPEVSAKTIDKKAVRRMLREKVWLDEHARLFFVEDA